MTNVMTFEEYSKKYGQWFFGNFEDNEFQWFIDECNKKGIEVRISKYEVYYSL